MAKLGITCVVLAVLCIFFVAVPSVYARKQGPGNADHSWFRSVHHGKETTAEIRFYLQDLLSGTNATAYEVARSSITSTSPTGFGQVRVFDDLLTAAIDYDSEVLGRAQGIISSANFETFGYAVSFNVVFSTGEYNGSTISVTGRNPVSEATREMSVVGGTGIFRMARGYCVTQTVFLNPAIDYAVNEFILYFTYPRKSNLTALFN